MRFIEGYVLLTDLTCDVDSGLHLVGAIHELPLPGVTRTGVN